MNSLETRVPSREIKGVDRLLTANDIAVIISRPVRYVRETLLQTGLIPSVQFGKYNWRIKREDFIAYLDASIANGGAT